MTLNFPIALVTLLATLFAGAPAQDMDPLVESPDTHYYDFWVGKWAVEKDGKIDPGATSFTVTRGVHPAALEEAWGGGMSARGLRTWDKTAGRWMHVWVSANGLFQVWEGRKVGADWYMVKEFDIKGDRYLSRQAVLNRGDGRAVRISERSDDGGKTWTLRFKEDLRRVE
ncbi:MAG TPA: hypothetical protein VF147_07615 [Vicinamibacterales bacterium]